mmetsp:Transcript_40380/g.75646  ORF Transcript_40380/g.75646 Transcript_40380/m.75646 type:complete len:213 (+) Transcript_40380:716-1354(+)
MVYKVLHHERLVLPRLLEGLQVVLRVVRFVESRNQFLQAHLLRGGDDGLRGVRRLWGVGFGVVGRDVTHASRLLENVRLRHLALRRRRQVSLHPLRSADVSRLDSRHLTLRPLAHQVLPPEGLGQAVGARHLLRARLLGIRARGRLHVGGRRVVHLPHARLHAHHPVPPQLHQLQSARRLVVHPHRVPAPRAGGRVAPEVVPDVVHRLRICN